MCIISNIYVKNTNRKAKSRRSASFGSDNVRIRRGDIFSSGQLVKVNFLYILFD